MATVDEWVLGLRPRTLPNSIVPVAVGTALAFSLDGFVWWKALSALMVSLALQIGVNFANDYSDGVKGTDTEERTGPTRLTATGLARPGQVLAAALGSFAFAGVIGLILVATTSWWLLLLGASAIAAAWYYTGGHSPYGYRGLGEVSVFVFFGVAAVVGTVFVQLGSAPWQAWVASLPVGLLSCAVLVINNLRDIPTDEETGKITLAVRIGAAGTRKLYAGMIVGSYVVALALIWVSWWVPLVLLSVPLAVPPLRRVLGDQVGHDLVLGLGETGRLQMVFGLLFTVALALGQGPAHP